MTDYPNSAGFFPQAITIQGVEGGVAKISPYGANVLSWIPADDQECLFLSPKAEFRAGTAIRGGVPVIFPQFAELGGLTKHGFARTVLWDVARVNADCAVFWLSETPATYQIWPHRFLAEYTVRIAKKRLEMSLSITNIDVNPFAFTAALHTYLKVQDVRTIALRGLDGLHYRDSAQAGLDVEDIEPQVTFPGEVDRTYPGTPPRLQLLDGSRVVYIQSAGFPDAVVWNPGPEKCVRLADMELHGYLQFVCVEAAAVANPISLAPGESWLGRQILAV